jgi:hypothetical protein
MHLDARGVQQIKRLQKGRVTPGCYIGRTQKRCAHEGAACNDWT